MPFPATLAAMFSSGYDYARWEHCAACGEPVEVYTTPGGRTIAMEPMCSSEAPSREALRSVQAAQPHPGGAEATGTGRSAPANSDVRRHGPKQATPSRGMG